jgi:hypothetical protein
LLKHEHKPVVLSENLLRYWHGRLNRELFRGKLGKAHLTSGRSRRSVGRVDGYYVDHRIHIDRRVRTKRDLVNVMAHEMIHQMQDQYNQPIDHGKDFRAWAARLIKKGVYV